MKMTSMFKNISDMEVLNSKALEEKELDKGILVHLYSHGYVLVAHHMKVKASVESKFSLSQQQASFPAHFIYVSLKMGWKKTRSGTKWKCWILISLQITQPPPAAVVPPNGPNANPLDLFPGYQYFSSLSA
ncbi:uncharacterized protein LOC122196749 [Lactuca sativa]|uniref:uncharacterized protein LOC122196749 n=1 Tax=Lactuca sativa TaxID=4236 RepID=UPI001C68FA1C|nr:uncharacterized protein LOC122196749 [Lactuca sativa]